MKNAIIIGQSVVILILLFVVFKDNLPSLNEEKELYEKYEQIKDKSILDMSEEEWHVHNLIKLNEAKKINETVDTISLEEAKNQVLIQAIINEQNNPCREDKIIEAFHEIMEFNMPYQKYSKNSIQVQKHGDCVYRINVTTKDSESYNWKTFWVFEVFYDEVEENYKLNTIIRNFLG